MAPWECLNETSLKGMEVRGDLASSSLYLSIPQAYLDYISEDWEPPSRWDEGIPGVLLDYNLNAQAQRQLRAVRGHTMPAATARRAPTWGLGGYGPTGASISHQSGAGQGAEKRLEWSRYYAYRALSALRSKLTAGEDYLDSGLFDSFRFGGVSLRSDDSMLPPNLRGYAPEVGAWRKSNAKVIISQQGRYCTKPRSRGPFRIQDIDDAVPGELNVRVEEQDGSVQEFTMNTASIPYLTRPGSVRYKLALGQNLRYESPLSRAAVRHRRVFPGVSNGWSLYGGALLGGDYNAAALGIGRDLMLLGAMSFDITQSRARLPYDRETLSGGSYRLSY